MRDQTLKSDLNNLKIAGLIRQKPEQSTKLSPSKYKPVLGKADDKFAQTSLLGIT